MSTHQLEIVGAGNTLIFSSFSPAAGLSAYQIALKNGFVGSESEWLISLISTGAYQHQQTSPSATWVINHNFDRYPAVSLYTTGGAEMIGHIINISTNQCVAGFDTPIAGYAIVT